VQASVETASRDLLSRRSIIPGALAAPIITVLSDRCRSAMADAHHFPPPAEDLTVENLIKQVAYYAVWVLGSLLPLTLSGLNLQTLVTGLGLTSLSRLASRSKHYLKFHQCILILTLRPFRLGDQIIVGKQRGTSSASNCAPQPRTYDGRVVLVPNAEVFTALINNTALDSTRQRGHFIGYDSDLRY